MLLLLKSISRTVHHCHDHPEKQNNTDTTTATNEPSISLTVWTKSLLLSCTGFTVIASQGTLAYRVDNYTVRPAQIILMDGSGNPIFTISRCKRLRLVDNYWLVYEGEVGNKYCNNYNTNSCNNNKPVFCVRKSISIKRTKLNVLAYVYGGICDKRHQYVIEGSYTHRSCKILDESRKVVGEIKRKEATREGVSYGLDVFHLMVRPGFDSRFGMAIVLVLDQMFPS